MRYLAQAVVVALAICSSTHALAADHAMKVGEVLLSHNGDPGHQFVELEDAFAEAFPSPPYTIELYSAAGIAVAGPQTITVPSGTTRFLLASPGAGTTFGTPDATLGFTLPTDGQLCFARGTTKIHCLAWGCITGQVQGGFGSDRAPSPSDGLSAQRQANGTYQVGTPTPGAANQAGTTMANCASEPDGPPAVDGPVNTGPDAGVAPDAGGGGNNNGGDGGCCQVAGPRGAAGAALLAFVVMLALRRGRRKASR